jgi:hypothetical protein
LSTALLAEALRHHRHGRVLLLEDQYAKSRALERRGTDRERLECWIANLRSATGLMAAIDAMKLTAKLAVAAVLCAALLAGAGAAATVLDTSSSRVVEFPLALVALVLVQLAFLALWIVLVAGSALVRRGRLESDSRPRLLAMITLALMRLLGRVVRAPAATREDRFAAASAFHSLLDRRASGAWLFAAVTHTAWLAFTIGALLFVWLRLIAVQYDFAWGTTLLSEQAAASILLALATGPALAGFSVPDAALLEATRLGSEAGGAGREIWGAFLLGSLVVYGVFPRFTLAAVCGVRGWLLTRRAGIDAGHVLWQEALIALARERSAPGPIGPPPGDVLARSRRAPPRERFGQGSYVVLIGMELDEPRSWPPQPIPPWALPLGHVASRAEARQVLDELARLTEPPRLVAAVGSMVRTPDRGAMDLLAEMACAVEAPVMLVLAESSLIGERGIDAQQREAEWRDRAGRVGIRAVMPAELDQLARMPQEALEDALRRTGVS